MGSIDGYVFTTIVLGDFNAKVEINMTNDPGCHQKTSRNGK